MKNPFRAVARLTVTSCDGPRRHVAPAVATFLLRYPQIQVGLHVSDEIVDLVNQRVDVAIRIGVLDDSDLLATTLAPQRRVAVASPAYLARAGHLREQFAIADGGVPYWERQFKP